MKCLVTTLACLISTAAALHADIVTEPVEYSSGKLVLKGFLAQNSSIEGPRPGVLVVHEWWGHNAYARRRARMLAELGYTALAVDMYGDGKQASHPEDAGKFSKAVMNDVASAKARFLAAKKLLEDHETVDATRIAAIGYCFGGGVVLHMARSGVDLAGVASFHGSLGTKHPAKKGHVKAKVLVCHGAADKFISKEVITAFKKEMQDAGVDMKFIAYPGALHSFTNPEADKFGEKFELPLAYDADADMQSWEDLQTFFKEIFARDTNAPLP